MARLSAIGRLARLEMQETVSKPEIREQLGRLGIDASVLFPELDKAADIIAAKYKKRLEDDLGI